MEQGSGAPMPGVGVSVLLALRFALEIALLASYAIIATDLVHGWAGWLLAVVAMALVGSVWGVLLSPRRPVRWPVGVRMTIELVLFGIAAAGLALIGHGTWAIVLVMAELIVLGLLQGPDRYAI